MQIQPICKNSYALYYGVYSNKWTNVKIQIHVKDKLSPCLILSALLPAQCWELGGQKSLEVFLMTNNSILLQRRRQLPTFSPWHSVSGQQDSGPNVPGAISLLMAQLKAPGSASIINHVVEDAS